MSTNFTFKKGDLIGINENDHIYAFIIVQVIRHNRFFYCYCMTTGGYHFVVYDPQNYFLLCPDFNPNIEPDIDVLSMGVEFYEALDRLFGFSEDEEDSADW